MDEKNIFITDKIARKAYVWATLSRGTTLSHNIL